MTKKSLYVTVSKIDTNNYKIEAVNKKTDDIITVPKPKIIKEVYSVCNNVSQLISLNAFKKFYTKNKNFNFILIPELGKDEDSDYLYKEIKNFLSEQQK
jgi:hypothetical protein